MALTRVEKERISDSRLKVQSVAKSLQHVDPNKVPNFEEIEDCLEGAAKSLGKALQAPSSNVSPGGSRPKE